MNIKIPEYWTPAQALMVYEFLSAIQDGIWRLYGKAMQDNMAEDQYGFHDDPEEITNFLEDDIPF